VAGSLINKNPGAWPGDHLMRLDTISDGSLSTNPLSTLTTLKYKPPGKRPVTCLP
jgi:hypothetical protein